MNYKSNLKLYQTILSFFMLIFFTVPSVSYAIFSPVCNTNTISDENNDKPIIISIFSDSQQPIPEQFNIKVIFDNDVFKKSAKIDYNTEISRNYKHNKSICGNEVSVCCSLKDNKIAPIIPKNQELFSLTMECKKYISKSETNLTVIAEGNFKNEKISLPIKIQTSFTNTSAPILNKLVPCCGNLNPPFNPNTTEYTLCVPYDTNDITFEHEAGENYSVKINRHKLQAPGNTTDIYIAVKQNRKTPQNVYHISVKRESKPEKEKSPKEILSEESSPEEKTTSNKKSHRSKSKRKSGLFPSIKHEKYDCPDEEQTETEKKPLVTKNIELKSTEKSTQNNKKIYSIVILSSILVISGAYLFINRKKLFKNKIPLNKTSEK